MYHADHMQMEMCYESCTLSKLASQAFLLKELLIVTKKMQQ